MIHNFKHLVSVKLKRVDVSFGCERQRVHEVQNLRKNEVLLGFVLISYEVREQGEHFALLPQSQLLLKLFKPSVFFVNEQLLKAFFLFLLDYLSLQLPYSQDLLCSL